MYKPHLKNAHLYQDIFQVQPFFIYSTNVIFPGMKNGVCFTYNSYLPRWQMTYLISWHVIYCLHQKCGGWSKRVSHSVNICRCIDTTYEDIGVRSRYLRQELVVAVRCSYLSMPETPASWAILSFRYEIYTFVHVNEVSTKQLEFSQIIKLPLIITPAKL